MSTRVISTASETVAAAAAGPQTRGMDAQRKATIREAAGRHPVNAFRLHHFAGLGCQ
jgi:type II secretory pathway component PulM